MATPLFGRLRDVSTVRGRHRSLVFYSDLSDRNHLVKQCTTKLCRSLMLNPQRRRDEILDIRQSLTICVTNYSGRASELGGIIELVDRRRPSLSRSARPPFSS